MRVPILPLLIVLLASGVVAAQPTLYVSPDVPTTPDGATYLPWEVIEHDPGGAPYSLEFVLLGRPAIDALHKMDAPDNWLFSFDAPTDLGGVLTSFAEPRDVVRYEAGPYSMFFDGDCVTPAVPLGSKLDGVHLLGSDSADLVVSFDVPTTLGATTYLPSQLVRYQRTSGPPCGWTLAGLEADFTFGTYFPASAKITGVGRTGARWILSIDIPVDVGPPGPVTRLPGQIVSTDGTTWSLLDDLQASGTPGWPISSVVDALSCEANPGRIDSVTHQWITMDKDLPSVTINCPASCASGGTRYGLYEGSIASLRTGIYDHAKKSCLESCPGSITFDPANGDRYFLVVPHNGSQEGSYGLDSNLAERPQAVSASARCMAVQNLTPCP